MTVQENKAKWAIAGGIIIGLLTVEAINFILIEIFIYHVFG